MTESERADPELSDSGQADYEMNESVIQADQWSPIIALGVAIAMYGIGTQFLPSIQIAAIIAAFTAVGVRLYVPYHASMQVPEEDRIPIHEHPTAGGYHHGAVGLGLVVGWITAFVAHAGGIESTPSLGIGVGVTIGAVLVLRMVLPRS